MFHNLPDLAQYRQGERFLLPAPESAAQTSWAQRRRPSWGRHPSQPLQPAPRSAPAQPVVAGRSLPVPVLFWRCLSLMSSVPFTFCLCDCCPVPDWMLPCPITCTFPVFLNPVCLVPRYGLSVVSGCTGRDVQIIRDTAKGGTKEVKYLSKKGIFI